MMHAIRLAKKGYPAPNPHVGCVLVQKGELVGAGWHRYRGADHAEVMALKIAGVKARGATAFVTLEPCNHTSSLTGPCSEALLTAGIREVYYANADPNPVATGGALRLSQAGVPVYQGLLADRARSVNEQFLAAVERQRTYVVLKAALSSDGAMGVHGRQVWITGKEAQRAAHRLRAECGSVLVGRNTVEIDNPLLTARILGVRNQPVRIVLDAEHRLSEDYRIFDRQVSSSLRVTLPGQGGDLEIQERSGEMDLLELTRELFQHRILGVLVEGGPATLDSFWRQMLPDRVELFVSAKPLPDGIRWHGAIELMEGKAPDFELTSKKRRGVDTQWTFRRKQTKL